MTKYAVGLPILAASLLLLSNCGSSSSPTPTPNPGAADVTISVVGINGASSFNPNPTTVTAGQTVSWKNNDSAVHQMVQDTPGFSSTSVSAGQSTTAIALSTRGTLTYHCSIHPTMVGTIVVQ